MSRRTPRLRGLLSVLAALALALTTVAVRQTASAAPPPWTLLRPGTNQVEVLGANSGDQLRLVQGS